MSLKRRHSQRIPFNAKKNKKIDHYFSQADKTQQNDANLPQTSMNSTKCPKDVTNPQAQGPTEQPVSTTKTMNVTLKGDHRAHVSQYSEGGNLYKALTSLQAVRAKIKTQKGKEILVRGTEGIKGYINLGMPLSCFPESCHLEITFVQSGSKQKKENQEFVRCRKESSKCVKFYIHAVGKELRRIVKSKHLHKKGCKLCIYAFQEETIRQALCKDGRLLPFLESADWKLVENGDTILENTQLVGDLEGRVFEVEVEKRKFTRADMAENSESEKRNLTPLNERMVEQYPSLKGESEKIKANLKKNVELSKESTLLTKLYKTDFGKMVQNSIPVKRHRLLGFLGNSVGRIEWDNNGREGLATCFVFSGPYIFTCGHVASQIVGEGIELSDWISIISQYAKVTFDYEDSSREQNKYFFIDPSFFLTGNDIDYAVLKLKGNEQFPLGLYRDDASVPLNGLVHIIGHPNGEIKRSDACVVIPQNQREEEFEKRLQARKAEGCQSVHMFTQQSFQTIAKNPDVITYDTSFYFGSSGSPIFNSSGILVAMHSAGFAYEYQNGQSSIIEFGPSIKSILRNIYQTEAGKDWLKEIDGNIFANLDLPVEDVEMLSPE